MTYVWMRVLIAVTAADFSMTDGTPGIDTAAASFNLKLNYSNSALPCLLFLTFE